MAVEFDFLKPHLQFGMNETGVKYKQNGRYFRAGGQPCTKDGEDLPVDGSDIVEADDAPATIDFVIEAIKSLNQSDEAHWTSAGLPDCRVLTEKCKMQITKSMRDEAWEKYTQPAE